MNLQIRDNPVRAISCGPLNIYKFCGIVWTLGTYLTKWLIDSVCGREIPGNVGDQYGGVSHAVMARPDYLMMSLAVE